MMLHRNALVITVCIGFGLLFVLWSSPTPLARFKNLPEVKAMYGFWPGRNKTISYRSISCNTTVAEEYRKSYSSLQPKKPFISEEYFLLLDQVQSVIRENGGTPCLCFGTLLGWYRECGLIPWTEDLDLCMSAGQYSEKLITSLRNDSRFEPYWALGRVNDSFQITVHKGKVKLDIFFIYRDGDRGYAAGLDIPNKREVRFYFPNDFTQHLCKSELLNTAVLVPCNPEIVVRSDYGPKWHAPFLNKDFSWKKSASNMMLGRFYTKEEWKGVCRSWAHPSFCNW